MEREERKRQVPFHMQLNTELVDFVYLLSAMLLEIPNLSAHQHSINKSVISKPFRKLMESYERQLFNGPPDYYRDNVVYAARALYESDWKRAMELIAAVRLTE